MKRLSVKLKLTIWITLLMLLLVALVLGFMMALSSSVVAGHTYDRMTATVRDNLSGISKEDGVLSFREDFPFAQDGIYILVYNASGALPGHYCGQSFSRRKRNLKTVQRARLRDPAAIIMWWISGCPLAGKTVCGCAV